MRDIHLYNGKKFKTVLAALCGLLFVSCGINPGQTQSYDIIIKNGRVIDGTGNPWFKADIAINGDEIVKIAKNIQGTAADSIDAEGLYVAPGFIDSHSHAAEGLAKPELSDAKALLLQGITTVFINPDGSGAVDLKTQKQKLTEHGIGVNAAQLVPFGSVRNQVMGMADRAPDSEEMEAMRELVRAGMEEGAFGLSSGVFYAPQSYASTEEIVDLAGIAAAFGGVYQSHIRDESNYTVGVRAAVKEVIEIAEKAGITGVVDHIKVLGPPVWGLSKEIVADIEEARQAGTEILACQYPYNASSTSLIAALVPRWAEEGGYEALVARLNTPGNVSRIKAEMTENLARRGGAGRIQFRSYPPDTGIEGQMLEEVARERGLSAVDTAVELIKKGRPAIVSFNMEESDIIRFMQQPWTLTCSDGGLVEFGSTVPHPRNYGTFPRKIRKYVLEDNAVDVSFAVRSMTSLPAQVYGMADRGMLRKGTKADIVIFDLEHLRDKAVFTDPHQYSEGMVYVLVNGRFAVQKGRLTETRNGQILTRFSD